MRGFSMVELMIVMVIIGILGTMAIPAYQEYVVRAKVMTLLAMAQPIKLAVTEGLLEGSEPKIEKIVNQDAAKEISVAGNVITIIGDSKKLGVSPKTKTLKLTLSATTEHDRVKWKCVVEPLEFNKYVPSECRSQTDT